MLNFNLQREFSAWRIVGQRYTLYTGNRVVSRTKILLTNAMLAPSGSQGSRAHERIQDFAKHKTTLYLEKAEDSVRNECMKVHLQMKPEQEL